MANRTYGCGKCDWVLEVNVPVSDPCPQKITRKCQECNRRRVFHRVILRAPYVGFGMTPWKYSGQAAAVKGWGTHALDYPKEGSDLIRGRAMEAAAKHNLP